MVEEGMMPYVSYSLVVRDPESCESLREGLDHLLRSLKEELDLFFLYEGREDPSPDVVMHVWWEPQHTKLDVRLVCDAPLAASYVNVTAPDKEQAVAVLGAIAGMVFLVKAGMLSGSFYIQSAMMFATALLILIMTTG
jgi:hypothetical protein